MKFPRITSKEEERKGNAGLVSVKSITSEFERENAEVDLQVVTSHPISLNDVGQELTEDEKYYILRKLNYDGLTSLENLPIGASYMIEKVAGLTVAEAVELLRRGKDDFRKDSNFPEEDYEFLKSLLAIADSQEGNFGTDVTAGENGTTVKEKLASGFGDNEVDSGQYSGSELEDNSDSGIHWTLKARTLAATIYFHSPYPEVRSVTDPYDDPSIPCETLRVYVVGIIWTAIGAVINQFFSVRQPSISLNTAAAQLFVYPSGELLAYIVPKRKVKIVRFEFDLNPGPWTFKEQMLVTIFYAVSASATYATQNNILTQKLDVYYGSHWADFGFQVLLVLSTQFMGFGFAGIMRKVSVYPAKSIFPTLLPTLALNKALLQPEKKQSINGWTISRYNFFLISTASAFLYYWIPNYLMGFLFTFNWMTWIKPENFNLATITGSSSGLGFNPISTFDWSVINYNLPMQMPFFSICNQYIGSIIAFFAIVGLYYSNYKWTSYLPINTNLLYNNKGEKYEVGEILNEKNLFDHAKYEEYGPPFYSAASLILYGAFFALYPFIFVYEVAVNFKAIVSALQEMKKSFTTLKSNYDGFDDPFSKSMRRYKEVPDWVFVIILIITIVLAIIMVEIYPTNTPVWTIFFAVGVNFCYLIPVLVLYGITGYQFSLNVLIELVIGYALPGNPNALNIIKCLGTNFDLQADNYVTSQKQAHYWRIPPRSLFRVQLLSVFVSSFVQLGILSFQLTIDNICEAHQKNKFTCPGQNTFFTASVVWGAIGPKRVFDKLYPVLKYSFLIGFLLAIVLAPVKIYGPRKYTKYFQPTLIIGGFLLYAPYNLSYATAGFYVAFVFMYYIRKHYMTWWEKYNYVLVSSLTAGYAFSAIIVFFTVQYHPKDINWWGNTVSYAGLDGLGIARYNATVHAPDGYFGPRKGNY